VLSEPCNNASEFQAINLDDLQLNSLEARMPPEIALLTSLRSISLYNNSINASLDDFLPSELYQLTNLTQLNLASNHQLERPVDDKITSLISLVTLDIFDADLASNHQLTELHIELESVANMPLFPVSLSNYTLHGELPGPVDDKIAYFISLTLDFDAGSLPSELGLMNNLLFLGLEYNQLTGSLPSELGLLTDMVGLFLGTNALHGKLPGGCPYDVQYKSHHGLFCRVFAK
jgi:Leucine-rich repeat (LRR) protein